MNNSRPARPKARTGGWGRILLATAAIIGLGWAGIGLDPASLNLDGWRWIVEADSPTPRLVRVFAHDGEVGAIAWSPDGSKVAAGGQLHRALMIWDARTGALLHNLNREDGSISAVAWSPDGKYVAAGRWFTRIYRSHVAINVWDGETGQRLHGLQGPLSDWEGANDVPQRALAFSPDSTTLAAGHRQAISLHDVRTGRRLATIQGQGAIGRVVVFSPDGAQILTSGVRRDSPIEVFETTSGGHKRSLGSDPERPSSLAYRVDGQEIATADGRRPIITLLDARTGQVTRILTGHSQPVSCVTYSRDGRLLASAAPGGGVIVWAARSGERLMTLPSPSELADSIAFSPDGRSLAVPVGKQVRLWDLSRLPLS
jgi:WD40 repeat protein